MINSDWILRSQKTTNQRGSVDVTNQKIRVSSPTNWFFDAWERDPQRQLLQIASRQPTSESINWRFTAEIAK